MGGGYSGELEDDCGAVAGVGADEVRGPSADPSGAEFAVVHQGLKGHDGYVEFGAQRLQALEIAVGNGLLEPAVVEFLQCAAHAQGFAQGVGAAGRVV